MPSFSRNLEQSLHRALAVANERHHEYATLEHLLLSLTEDVEAAAVLRACSIDLDLLKKNLREYIEQELENLVSDGREDAKPTAGFQRVIQRAVIHVQSSGREEVTGANVLVAIFAERESHAAYFLQEQDMTRYDAVNYISHGIAKRPGLQRLVQGTARGRRGGRGPRGQGRKGRGRLQEEGGRARRLLRQPQQEGQGRQDRPADRPRDGGHAHHPGAVPPLQEQPAARRRPRRRQDGDRRRPGAQDHQGRGARGARRRDRVRARHGHAARRHALPRRLRGAPQAGDEGDREPQERDPLHRRDPHRHRRRRHVGRRDGRLQPAEARAGAGLAALHRLDHLQGVPPVFREGSRARPPFPEDRRQRAVRPRRDRDPQGAQALFRGVPQGEVHDRGREGRG